jgi:hypothetical protein
MTAGAVPSELLPHKFGAQNFCHQPLAEASGMNVDLTAQSKQIMLRTSVRS